MAATSFYLRGIDLVDLTQRYVQGEFTQLIFQIPVSVTPDTVASRQVISTVSKSTLRNHEFTNESGRTFVYVGYRLVEGGKYGEVAPGTPANCMHCLRQVNPATAVGIPISKQVKYPNLAIYHCVDVFCYFGCLLAELRKRLCYRNTIYAYSMSYLAEMYELTTGKSFSTCRPAADNRLLKIFNGTMDYEEFHGDVPYSSKPENIYYLSAVLFIEKDA
jgi:hypothetical protein